MLRMLLLGVLVASAGAACKSKSDAPAVAVGTAAGKVVELSGKVDATRDGKTRTLAVGAEIYGDDQIATAADANVTIELFHNGAKWSVVSNKTARVDASLAWGLDKQAASKAVEHNSAAAGRNAERSAADTASTTDMKKEEAKPAAATEAAPMQTPVAPEPTGGAQDRGGPPPPPPPPAPTVSKNATPPTTIDAPKLSKKSGGGGAPGGAQLDGDAPEKDMKERERAAVVITPQELAEHHRPDFAKCLDKSAPKITITMKVAKNKTTVSLAGPGNITDKVRSCVDAVAQKIEWPIKGSVFEVKLKFD